MKFKLYLLMLVFGFSAFTGQAQKQRSIGTFIGVSKNNAIQNPSLSFGTYYQLTYNKLTYGLQYTRSNTLNTGFAQIDAASNEIVYEYVDGTQNNFALYLGTKVAGNEYWSIKVIGGSSVNLGSSSYDITKNKMVSLDLPEEFDNTGNNYSTRISNSSYTISRNSLDFMGIFVGLSYHQAIFRGLHLDVSAQYHQFFEKHKDGSGEGAFFNNILPTMGISYVF